MRTYTLGAKRTLHQATPLGKQRALTHHAASGPAMQACLRPLCPPSASTYRCIRTNTLVPRAYRPRPAPPAPVRLPPSTTQAMSRASAPGIAQTGANLPNRPRRESADLPPEHLPGLRSCLPASATLLGPTFRRLLRCSGRSRVPGRHAGVCRAAPAVHASCRSMDEMLEIEVHPRSPGRCQRNCRSDAISHTKTLFHAGP